VTGLTGEWWFWFSLAAVTGIVEVLAPGFVFLGFAIGGVAMGILLATGVLTVGPAMSMLLFAVLSLCGYVALRLVLGKAKGEKQVIDKDINDY
jgi:membrane protein implicated in regulation of membrane protease activity